MSESKVSTAHSSTGVGELRSERLRPTSDGLWEVDLARDGGPVLGPYDTRGDAAQALVDYWAEQE